MNTMVAIALLALQFFGPGWSSEHKAYWEWQLGHKLEGYQEHRLSRGWYPDGNGPILGVVRWRPPEGAEPLESWVVGSEEIYFYGD